MIDFGGAGSAASRAAESVLELEGFRKRGEEIAAGRTEAAAGDLQAMEKLARSVVADFCRPPFDPAKNPEDAAAESEYKRLTAARPDAEQALTHAVNGELERQQQLGAAPSQRDEPAPSSLLVATLLAALAGSISPTVHDALSDTLSDQVLVWLLALALSALFGAAVTLPKINSYRTPSAPATFNLGLTAGIGVGVALFFVRMDLVGRDSWRMALGWSGLEIFLVLATEAYAGFIRRDYGAWYHQENEPRGRALRLLQADAAAVAQRRKALDVIEQGIASYRSNLADRAVRSRPVEELVALILGALTEGYQRQANRNWSNRQNGVFERIPR